MSDLVNKVKASAKEGVEKAKPVTTFVGMNSAQIGLFLSNNYALQIAQLLPKEMQEDSERVIQQCVMVINQNAALKACTPESIIGAVMTCAMLGFEPHPSFNQCFFIPRNEKRTDANGKDIWVPVCEFQIGYKGWVQLLNNTGLLVNIYTKAVSINEPFKQIGGSENKIIHEPGEELITFDNFRGAYAVIRLRNPSSNVISRYELYYHKQKIEHLRKKGNKGKPELTGAWKTDYEAMAIVKVLKALIHNELPISTQIKTAIKSNEAIIDISNSNMATKELIPTPVEETAAESENVQMEGQEVKEQNPQNIGSDTEFYKWFEESKKKPIFSFDHETLQEIARRIFIGEIAISDVPNEWLNSKEIENAIFEREKKGIIG